MKMFTKQRFWFLGKCVFILMFLVSIAVTYAADSPTPGNTSALPAAIFPPAIIDSTRSAAANTTTYDAYTELRDPTEALRFQVPVDWKDIDMGAWTYPGLPAGVFVAASDNLAKFYAFQHPGVFVGALRALNKLTTTTDLLTQEASALDPLCVPTGRFTYADPYYQGKYDRYVGCTTGNGALYIAALESASKDDILIIRMVVNDDADLDAMANVFQSVQLIGPTVDDH